MGIWSTISRHSAVASGNFNAMFKDSEIPPLPAAVSRLLKEINCPEPDIERLANVVSSDPEIAAKVLRTVNSSLFASSSEIVGIQHTTTMLGLRHIKSLVIAYAMRDTLPEPDGDVFDHQAFWTDSLLKAMLARELTVRTRSGDDDHAFTAMLLADMALPMLLTYWGQYYEPVVNDWGHQPGRLSDFEQKDFGWNHGDAGSWILSSWGFSDDLVHMVGAHNLPPQRLHELELHRTIALPLSIASLLPSVLKADDKRLQLLWSYGQEELSINPGDWSSICASVRDSFSAVCQQFGVTSQSVEETLGRLATGPECPEETR